MIIIVILALFAFRSIFFVMPFGIFPGLARSVGDVGPFVRGLVRRFRAARRAFALVLLPVAFIILWGAVLIWVYRDAEKRGMSGILWLLLVLIGNVIGLLIYAIVRSETPIKRRAEGARREARGPEKCPGCGNASRGARLLPLLRKEPEADLPGLRQDRRRELEGLPGLRREDRSRPAPPGLTAGRPQTRRQRGIRS